MTPLQIRFVEHPAEGEPTEPKTYKPAYIEEIIVDGVKEPKDCTLGQIKAFDKAPKGWVRLSAVDHTEIFPIDGLGRLPEGYAWYLKKK